jgi:peptidoglycan/LPS O-acetylase OafA/YrhL
MIIWLFDRVCESRHLHPAAWLQFAVVATLAIAVAGVSFRYFETPIMRRRHRRPAAGTAATPQRA